MSDENDPYYTNAEERREAINAIFDCTKYWPCSREHRVFKGLLAEITRLRTEVAALKAQSDPLAEMWQELAEHQTQADKDGHGESWRIMCSERTHAAACNAARAARKASREAAWSASYAVREAEQRSATDAIAAIRRAKEAKP